MISAAFLEKYVTREEIWDMIFSMPGIEDMGQEEINKMIDDKKAHQQTDQVFLDTHGNQTWLVMEGDWGGQIYLSVPIRYVGEDVGEQQLQYLLSRIDRQAWSVNEGDGRSLYLRHTNKAESGVSGGMGGGLLFDGLWLYGEFGPMTVEVIRQALQLAEGTAVKIGDS
ncbi:hypothetical protein HN858_04640 [Candidatus Falkowbacteria bacterium]|jgi:hypothetical protein|nr:hypothetical protein [Candidatus Falkowbacteria bacterium]MBT5503518.1 hypothetical protein [Candidatus Falkowbacteria bacterium]MBT6574415.1 hypothetical protein [Candidatus Falkowbacteria bacterium]MBT7348932.1 hypothetical protein [Candidatus Falkowbacteria bacterium]MBT7501288.1 hypothetical protein [Candidatus Falkowbacteria bacterium]